MYVSDVNQQGKSVKVAGSDMSVVNQQGKGVKVAVCICQMAINQEEELRYAYDRCLSTRKKC